MRKKLVLAALLTLSLLVLSAGGYVLGQRTAEYAEGDEAYSGLEEYVSFPSSFPGEDESGGLQQTETPQVQSGAPNVDFAALSRINPDIVGWLYCEGTQINYPVVQGSDDEYYLDHLFDGTQNASGCLFLDSRVDASFSSVHSIIYGHHMRSGAMFAALDGYKRQSFYDAHPTMLLITPDATYEVPVGECLGGELCKLRGSSDVDRSSHSPLDVHERCEAQTRRPPAYALHLQLRVRRRAVRGGGGDGGLVNLL